MPHRGVDVSRADVAQRRGVRVPSVRESPGEHAGERSPLLRGRIRAEDRERLAPLCEHAGLDNRAEVLRDDGGGNAHVRPGNVGRDVRGARLLPEFGTSDGSEDERVGVTPRSDTRGDGAGVIAHDERALHLGVGRVHDLRGLVRRRRPRSRARLGCFSRGDRFGSLRDGRGWRGGGRRGRGFRHAPVGVHVIEEIHAVVRRGGGRRGRRGGGGHLLLREVVEEFVPIHGRKWCGLRRRRGRRLSLRRSFCLCLSCCLSGAGRRLLGDERVAEIQMFQEFAPRVLLEQDAEEAPHLGVLPRRALALFRVAVSLERVASARGDRPLEILRRRHLLICGDAEQRQRRSARRVRRDVALLRRRPHAEPGELPAEPECGAARTLHPRRGLLHRLFRPRMLHPVLIHRPRTRRERRVLLQIVKPHAAVEGARG